jgi:lipoate-protein ligase A
VSRIAALVCEHHLPRVFTDPLATTSLWARPVTWYRSPPRDAAANMAWDEAMRREAAATGAVLVRAYTWSAPSLSLGRNQRTRGIYSAARCEALGVPVVRRPTGGRALLHGREVTYCVAAPHDAAPALRGGYEAINDWLLDALRALGVSAARAVARRGEPAPGLAPCFDHPSPGELVVDGRKLVGSAQHREHDAFLQHGSILLDDDQPLLAQLALVPLPPMPAPATLRALLAPGIDAGAVTDALEAALRRRVPGTLRTGDDRALRASADEIRVRTSDPAWTWRR